MVLGYVSLQHRGQTRNISWLESGLQGWLGVGGFPRDVVSEGVILKRDGSMMVGRGKVCERGIIKVFLEVWWLVCRKSRGLLPN
jgi:hypothetical protein